MFSRLTHSDICYSPLSIGAEENDMARGTYSCDGCGTEFERTHWSQKYCPSCRSHCAVPGCESERGAGIYCRALGRQLRPEETVHHKNGIRTDFRLENLQLFASRHPPGQAVEDLVSFAITVLRDYPDEAGLQGIRLMTLESAESSALLEKDGLSFSDVMRAINSDMAE
jgi:hypothetical protein